LAIGKEDTDAVTLEFDAFDLARLRIDDVKLIPKW